MNPLEAEYDDIVVGGGSAGAAIASRLTEFTGRRVLLLEAGPDHVEPDEADRLTNPMTFAQALTAWGLNATLGVGREMGYAQGKVVGGGSAVNGALALRGMPADYDRWAAEGAAGWDWNALLPAFRRLETDLDIKNELHGDDGPVAIRRWAESDLIPIQRAFLGAAREAGFGWTEDHNDPASTGIGPFPMNRDGDLRLSTALTYVAQARSRPNLTVAGDARVDRLVLDAAQTGTRVTGVEITRAGQASTVSAPRVIVTAGALASPALLARSGIGPADDLQRLGIRCVIDNPNVGANLMDHPGTLIFLAPTDPSFCDPFGPAYQIGIRWTSGLGTENDMLTGMMNYWNTNFDPDLHQAAGTDYIFALTAGCHEPRSRGRLRLVDADPATPPAIDFDMLSERIDEDRLVEGLRLLRKLARSEAMKPVARAILLLDEAAFDADERGDDSALRAYIHATLGPWYHASGTCRMGPSPEQGSVVDPTLQVHGVRGLYVADASVIPVIPRAATNLTVLAVAERAADILAGGQS
ncbi:MAG TPA: GMC family oxidoreductase N-terminal domain-containing protein [Frankiaceae bacterium]|nr:GMC family oxidoreductase N-terminal domain-containing protein [Frankiaceae bacterium]